MRTVCSIMSLLLTLNGNQLKDRGYVLDILEFILQHSNTPVEMPTRDANSAFPWGSMAGVVQHASLGRVPDAEAWADGM